MTPRACCCLLFLAAGQAMPAAAFVEPEWSLRGRLQVSDDRYDGVYSASGQTRNASFVRRGNMVLGAQWPGGTQAVLGVQADSDLKLSVDNAYLAWRGVPGERLAIEGRLGRFDPDFGLEPSGSASWIVGIERSALWDLAPDAGDGATSGGLQLRATGDGWHGSASLFDKHGYRSSVARAAWQPLNRAGRLLHLGVSAAATQGWRDDGRIRSRLAVRGVSEHDDGHRPTLAGAADFDGDRAWVLESAAVWGAWSVQAEWLRRSLRAAATTAADRVAKGHYIQLAWTPTGQSRAYDPEGARFRGLRPGAQGPAIWEVFARHDRMAVRGARAAAVTAVGVNVYASRQWRVSANLLHARSDRRNDADDSRGRALSLRAQWLY